MAIYSLFLVYLRLHCSIRNSSWSRGWVKSKGYSSCYVTIQNKRILFKLIEGNFLCQSTNKYSTKNTGKGLENGNYRAFIVVNLKSIKSLK